MTLQTQQGEPIELTLDLDADPSSNAQERYERALELEAELERKQAVVGQLAPMPADPVAYVLLYHLDTVEGNHPRSMAGHLDTALRELEHAAETEAVTAQAARGRVADLEARIDQVYRRCVERELSSLETRIETAYREADARVEAGTAEARRLRVVVAVLLAVLVIGGVAVAALLLGVV